MIRIAPRQLRSAIQFHAPRREGKPRGRRHRRLMLETLEFRRLLSGMSLFPVPSPGVLPSQITSGPDGNVWFTEGLGNIIGMIHPTTHVVTEFTLPGNYGLVGGIMDLAGKATATGGRIVVVASP
jgi:hypothetical protein